MEKNITTTLHVYSSRFIFIVMPALFKTSAIERILETVPLHFQFPPIRAFANFGADMI